MNMMPEKMRWVLDRLSQSGVAGRLIGVALLIFICSGVYLLIRRGLIVLVRRQILSSGLAAILRKTAKYTMTAVFIILVAQYLGIGLGNLWVFISAILAMVAVGFVAVWSVISNILCTMLLLILKPFRIGDELEILDTANPNNIISGKAVDINIVYTTLEQSGGRGKIPSIVLVPNNIFFQKYIRLKRGKSTLTLDEQMFHPDRKKDA